MYLVRIRKIKQQNIEPNKAAKKAKLSLVIQLVLVFYPNNIYFNFIRWTSNRCFFLICIFVQQLKCLASYQHSAQLYDNFIIQYTCHLNFSWLVSYVNLTTTATTTKKNHHKTHLIVSKVIWIVIHLFYLFFLLCSFISQ